MSTDSPKTHGCVLQVRSCWFFWCAVHERAGAAEPDSAEAAWTFIVAIEKNDARRLVSYWGRAEDCCRLATTCGQEQSRGFPADIRLAFAGCRRRNTMTLQVGESDWPLPIPIVNEVGMVSDGAAGADEIIYRRIGRNGLVPLLHAVVH
jgi:hypothetical protein